MPMARVTVTMPAELVQNMDRMGNTSLAGTQKKIFDDNPRRFYPALG